ncbi:hypothetical protein T11_4830 [Trichinella zimbabwensis]|uniref:Uncharacterized protein n=1 Tax=Trichinella zimbabwensis TaxID=268475 RepID=A0A0V1HFK2_9BILA|nr:hypothetical protein T11_4830 [Trichinella zimbabwensis]
MNRRRLVVSLNRGRSGSSSSSTSSISSISSNSDYILYLCYSNFLSLSLLAFSRFLKKNNMLFILLLRIKWRSITTAKGCFLNFHFPLCFSSGIFLLPYCCILLLCILSICENKAVSMQVAVLIASSSSSSSSVRCYRLLFGRIKLQITTDQHCGGGGGGGG